MIFSVLLVYTALLLANNVEAWPDKYSCSGSFTGTAMGGDFTAVDNDAGALIVKDSSGNNVPSGSEWKVGEKYTYTYSDSSGQQWAAQLLSGGLFDGSSDCNGRRLNTKRTGTFKPDGDVNLKIAATTARNTDIPTYTFTMTTPGGAPVTTSSLEEYDSNVGRDTAIGVIVGLGGIVLIAGALMYFLNKHEKGEMTVNDFPSVFGALGCVMGLVSLILVASWTNDHFRYLGDNEVDSQIQNHAVLMVAGFFFGQVIAYTVWGFFEEKTIAKSLHVLFHTVAILTMIAGLIYIVRYYIENKIPQLSSVHSWMGVMAVALYCLNYLWGFIMSMLTKFAPDTRIRQAIPLLYCHKCIGMAAFVMTAIAIVSGIQLFLSGACSSYDLRGRYEADMNPAENYPHMYDTCKIGNGLGVTIVLATLFTSLAILNRNVKISTNEPIQQVYQASAPNDALELTKTGP